MRLFRRGLLALVLVLAARGGHLGAELRTRVVAGRTRRASGWLVENGGRRRGSSLDRRPRHDGPHQARRDSRAPLSARGPHPSRRRAYARRPCDGHRRATAARPGRRPGGQRRRDSHHRAAGSGALSLHRRIGRSDRGCGQLAGGAIGACPGRHRRPDGHQLCRWPVGGRRRPPRRARQGRVRLLVWRARRLAARPALSVHRSRAAGAGRPCRLEAALSRAARLRRGGDPAGHRRPHGPARSSRRAASRHRDVPHGVAAHAGRHEPGTSDVQTEPGHRPRRSRNRRRT